MGPSKAKGPTKAERVRMARIALIGCLACRQDGAYTHAEVDHLLSGGKRRGHRFSIGLCSHHHRGAFPRRDGPTRAGLRKVDAILFGTSYEDWLEASPERRSDLTNALFLSALSLR